MPKDSDVWLRQYLEHGAPKLLKHEYTALRYKYSFQRAYPSSHTVYTLTHKEDRRETYS